MPRFLTALLLAAALGPAPLGADWRVPIASRKLSNGLMVVVSEDHSAPTFGLCISYGIGFRLEPEGRTGFAHLFEHMMFEGTPDAPKGVFDEVIEGGGGFDNGDTRYDFTEYIESAPISALDPVLWLEADRLQTLDFSVANLDNQRKVVEEEVRVNVLNQPYGSFYWLELPQKAFNRYPNAHNFYGDFKDLDAATIQDVKTFYKHYYAPNNAVMAVTGDVKPEEVFAAAEKYFGANAPARCAAAPGRLGAAADGGAPLHRAGQTGARPGAGHRLPHAAPAPRTMRWSAPWLANSSITATPRCSSRRWSRIKRSLSA